MSTMATVKALTNTWPKLMTAVELAEVVHLSPDRLRDLAESGFMPHYKIDGGDPMFVRREAVAWIKSNLLEWNGGEALPVHLAVISEHPLTNEIDLPKELRGLSRLRDITTCAVAQSGIYFLCREGAVVYVGQSTTVVQRIQAHLGKKQFDRVLFLPWPAFDLDRLEGAFIRKLTPALNGGVNGLSAPRGSTAADHSVLQEVFAI